MLAIHLQAVRELNAQAILSYKKFCAPADYISIISYEVGGIVKLIAIIADYHCLLYIAAATHSWAGLKV